MIMKRNLIFAMLIVMASGLWAQNCNLYIPLEEGKGFQYQNFNKRDKLEGVSDMIIKDVSSQQGATVATFTVKFYDNREKLQHEGEYEVTCKGDELIIDMESMLGQSVLKAYEGMEVSMTNVENLSIPGNLSVGDKLPDGRMEMKVKMGNVNMTEMKMVTQNREVVARESITTPAGTFNCFKITYETVMDARTMGMNSKNISKGVEFYAPGVGNVKSEFYNDKDQLQSYTLLSKIY
jgi:hypothetical protein